MRLEWSPWAWRRKWRNLKSEGQSNPSRLKHYWNWPEYWEGSWKLEKTCCHGKRPQVNAGVKKLLIIIIIIIINQQKKKRNCRIVDFADHRVKLKENEKRDMYLDLARELKKLWNKKVTIISIVIGVLGTITKGLKDLEIRGQVETIQTIVLLRSARILRRDQETWGDLLSLKLQWETIG